MKRLLAALMMMANGTPALAATVTVQPYGDMADGKAVSGATLVNDRGMSVAVIGYGARITSIRVPDRHGKMENVVLSLPDLAAFEKTKRRFAAVCGRYAGRIGNAQFTLDGKTVQLSAGPGGYAIHGDPNGYDRRVWEVQGASDAKSVAAVLHLVSPDGDQGFPGRLEVTVTYRLMRKANRLAIEYEARGDAPTVLNLTNHVFFNLAGAGASGIAAHRFLIKADRYAEIDDHHVPTGIVSSVAGTPLDFRQEAGVGTSPSLDDSLIFQGGGGKMQSVAKIWDAQSGRHMEVRTTETSVQFFTGNGFDGSETGSEGRAYQRNDGFAFETQHLPDSPNHANFPSTVLRPGQVFRSVTDFTFSASP